MSVTRSPQRTALPESAELIVVGLVRLSLVLALVAIFLLPFRAATTLTATLSALAGFLLVSAALAAALRAHTR